MKKLMKISAFMMAAALAAGCSSASTESSTESSAASESSAVTESSAASAVSETGEVSETLQRLREENNIVVAATNTAPFCYQDTETGELAGIDGEIAVAIANKLGIDNVEFKEVTFDNLLLELQNGNCDVVSSAMYITEERQQKALFSNIYYKEADGILYRADEDYASLEDMDGLVCAMSTGTGYLSVAEGYVEDGYFSRIDQYSGINEAVLAVTTGKADCAMADNVALAYVASQNVSSNLKFLTDYEPVYAGNIGAAFRQDDPAFVEEWNAALDELKEDGTILSILEKYGCDESYFVSVEDGQTVNPGE